MKWGISKSGHNPFAETNEGAALACACELCGVTPAEALEMSWLERQLAASLYGRLMQEKYKQR
jgi:hypothetical protein